MKLPFALLFSPQNEGVGGGGGGKGPREGTHKPHHATTPTPPTPPPPKTPTKPPNLKFVLLRGRRLEPEALKSGHARGPTRLGASPSFS